MAHSLSCEALVLRTYDVGEADRFCILFTKERGRIVTRASGVRRPGSRLGGFVLPFRHLSLQLRESSSGFFLSAASPLDPCIDNLSSLSSFTRAEEGIEVLLALVQHEQVDAAVFDATLAFLASCVEPSEETSLRYQMRLLHLLGLLPAEEEMLERTSLSESGRQFLRCARDAQKFACSVGVEDLRQLRQCCALLLRESLASPLRVPMFGTTISAQA